MLTMDNATRAERDQIRAKRRAAREARKAASTAQREAKWQCRSETAGGQLDARIERVEAETAEIRSLTERRKAASKAARDEARAAGAGWLGRQKAASNARKTVV